MTGAHARGAWSGTGDRKRMHPGRRSMDLPIAAPTTARNDETAPLLHHRLESWPGTHPLPSVACCDPCRCSLGHVGNGSAPSLTDGGMRPWRRWRSRGGIWMRRAVRRCRDTHGARRVLAMVMVGAPPAASARATSRQGRCHEPARAEISRTIASGAMPSVAGAGWPCRPTSPCRTCRPTARNGTRSGSSGPACDPARAATASSTATVDAWNRLINQPGRITAIA